MTTLETLMARNHDFTTHDFAANLPIMPSLRAMIVGCVDPRVDPALLLGLKNGEALVLRNVGGRITPATFQAMMMLQAISQSQGTGGGNPSGKFDLIVLHHTDCGITRLDGRPDILAPYFGIDPAELAAKAVSDPPAAVAVDVALLKANPRLASGWNISGLVYDVATGFVETVVAPDTL